MTQHVLFLAYRDWALHAVEAIMEDPSIKPYFDHALISEHDTVLEARELEVSPLVFALGWSWKIPLPGRHLHRGRITLIAHPSPLPRYRGGSPIQNQILAGEDVSALTLFEATEEMDAGPIFWQQGFSLDGTLDDVLDRIQTLTVDGCIAALQAIRARQLVTVPQIAAGETAIRFGLDHWKNWERRTPDMAELTPEMLAEMTGRQLHDFIRCQQPPYPQAFVRGNDGEMVLLDTRLVTKEDFERHGLTPGAHTQPSLSSVPWKRSVDAAKAR